MATVFTSEKPEMLVSQRDNHIDTIKFLLIFSIYIFHFGKVSGSFYPFVNIYQVSIFFIISGFWALKRINKSPLQVICDSFKKYLFYWFVWVLIYTAFFTVYNSLTPSETKTVFTDYFYAIRGTGISGMWFTPAFFLVSFLYYLFTKMVAVIFKISKDALAWIGLIFSFAVYFVTKYIFIAPQSLKFSLGYVPEYLFYFSIGAVIYIYIDKLRALEKTPVFLKILNCIITVISIAYFLMYFYKKEKILWGWASTTFDGKLSFLPDLITTLLMYFLLSCIARCVSSDFTARIGKNSLGLCHCEAFTKRVIMLTAGLFGLNVNATNPIQAVIFAFITLIVGCYVILPITNMITKRILSVNKTKKIEQAE